jgi:hypothetical protein
VYDVFGPGPEEFNASFAQRDGDLDAFIPKDEVFRPRKEVRNHLDIAARFVGVLIFSLIESPSFPPVAGSKNPDDVIAIGESDA